MSIDSVSFSKEIRRLTLKMVYEAKASHIGGAFSMADLLAVLYNGVLNIDSRNPFDENRDRFLLSKGHACTSLYATLAIKGFFPLEELDSYAKNDSRLLSHTNHKVPGVELSTGSLGHALSVACGLALGANRKGLTHKVYCLLSDGELDEGSNWEAILFAPHHRLSNLVLIIDYNKIQSFGSVKEVLELHPLKEKFVAFNWNTLEIDAHEHNQILEAMNKAKNSEVPTVIIAHSVKGKGVDFMENDLLWHYKSPSLDQYTSALKQLEK